jgi:hypothetical protein
MTTAAKTTTRTRKIITTKSAASRDVKPPRSRVARAAQKLMKQAERIGEIIAAYGRHGWRLERLLLRPETRAELTESGGESFAEAAVVQEAAVDALWFARASHAGREAWELRLVSETPYALFETFEADEAEEDREEVRQEMEARLRDYDTRPDN